MSFFNKKEEVIDIELTPYGKYLLSKGTFSPVYYEFYDDDIIYDSKYGDYEEIQGQIEERIKATPRPKTQYTFESAETRYKKYRDQVRKQGTLDVPVLEKRNNYSFTSLPLSNASADNENATAIRIQLLKGEIQESRFLDSIGMPKNVKESILKRMDTIVSVRKKRANENESLDTSNSKQVVRLGEDEIEVIKEDGYLLFDLQELGVDLRNDNFEIQLYEIETSGSSIVAESPLSFRKDDSNIRNGILYDYEEIEEQKFQDTDNFVEYFFSVMRDKEIPQDILCKHLSEEEISKLIAVEGYQIECEEIRMQERLRNPELEITEEEIADLEDC